MERKGDCEMRRGILAQSPAFRPFVGHLIVLAQVAIRASYDEIIRRIRSASRQWDNMINVVFLAQFASAVVAFAMLALVLGTYIISGVTTLTAFKPSNALMTVAVIGRLVAQVNPFLALSSFFFVGIEVAPLNQVYLFLMGVLVFTLRRETLGAIRPIAINTTLFSQFLAVLFVISSLALPFSFWVLSLVFNRKFDVAFLTTRVWSTTIKVKLRNWLNLIASGAAFCGIIRGRHGDNSTVSHSPAVATVRGLFVPYIIPQGGY
jgi:hypothetical protein